MPHWLQVIADWNPISALVQACRELWGNTPPLAGDDVALPLQYPVQATLIWTVLITAVVAPLAIRSFRRRTQD
jgi:ABC-type multidrug transport system permease subunit